MGIYSDIHVGSLCTGLHSGLLSMERPGDAETGAAGHFATFIWI